MLLLLMQSEKRTTASL